ncbi:hypothetical protein FACS1894151_11460 [Spirochaetia bacterium]|nr:hypothetical protein FACS1894151_11460 [Spirochaetia bacterium]
MLTVRPGKTEQETVKAGIALYDDIADKCRSAGKYRYEYNTEGGRDKITLEPVLDQSAIVAKLDALKQTRDEIEEKLAESNFRTAVDFDAGLVKNLL